MKKFFVLFTVLWFYAHIKAQGEKDSSNLMVKSLFQLRLSNASGLEYEKKISRQSTLSVFGGISAGYTVDKITFIDFDKHLTFVPDTYLEFKNYYNYSKRVKEKKKTINNSANFLFGRIEQYYAVKNQNYFGLLFSEGWGLQRNLLKHINIYVKTGITEHVYYDKPPNGGFNYVLIEPFINFSFLYLLINH